MTDTPQNGRELVDRIDRFVRRTDPLSSQNLAEGTRAELDELTLEVFAQQYECSPPYRRLCDARGRAPANVSDWSEIPRVPTSAFKLDGLTGCTGAHSGEVFRSSGTTLGEAARSVHYNPFPDLYRTIIDRGYSAFCLPRERFEASPRTLSLIPSRKQISDSSLGFMADHVLRFHADPRSTTTFDQNGVAFETAHSFLEECTSDNEPCMILATAFALIELVEFFEEKGIRLELPTSSALFETGGFKGRTREISREELLERTQAVLGVDPRDVVREYGMTELSSQSYGKALLGEPPDRLYAPPWLRVDVLDPQTLEPCEPGQPGLLAFFDLGNVGSFAAILTEDLGFDDGDGFGLLGRASGATLRGCSLTVEELRQA